MSKLYTEWAPIYDALYTQLFDYAAEYEYYGSILGQNDCQSVIEYGCGTGRLATHFLHAGYEYMGVDLSPEMIRVAQAHNPGACFMVGDLVTFQIGDPLDAALITGRTISYLLTNQQVLASFRAICQNLKPDGLLIFDAIDAKPLFHHMAQDRPAVLEVATSHGILRRESRNTPLLTTGWTWQWDTSYELSEDGEIFVHLGNDRSELRAFMREEIELLLTLSGFRLLETTNKDAYTWAGQYFVAQRKL